MGKYKKHKNSIEKFLSSEKGKRFFNFAYSIGAAIVILGALFKILYLPFGSLMLSIGMGVEVLMFCLSAFERPSKEYHWEEVFPVLHTQNPNDRPQFTGGGGNFTPATSTNGNGSYTEPNNSYTQPNSGGNCYNGGGYSSGELSQCVEQLTAISSQLEQLTQATTGFTATGATPTGQAIESPEFSVPTQGYATQMETLNRNLTGLNAMYEMQLRSVSAQLNSLEQVNNGLQALKLMYQNAEVEGARYKEETEKMTQLMAQLNSIYERMLMAMTVNMTQSNNTPSNNSDNTTI